jgi:hypothetical protein
VLHPLEELEIVDRTGLDELVHINLLVDAKLVEHGLKHFVVVDILWLRFGTKVDFAHGDSASVQCIDDLAVHSTTSKLRGVGTYTRGFSQASGVTRVPEKMSENFMPALRIIFFW